MSEKLVCQFDSYYINAETRELRYKGKSVKVEPKVFEFILVLVSNHKKIVSKIELADTLWPGGEVSDDMLSRCAYQARKALTPVKQPNQYIKTHHGLGYRFTGKVSLKSADRKTNKKGNRFRRSFSEKVLPLSTSDVLPVSEAADSTLHLGYVPIHIGTLNVNPVFSSEDLNRSVIKGLSQYQDLKVLQLNAGKSELGSQMSELFLSQNKLNYLVTGEITQLAGSNAVFLDVVLHDAQNKEVCQTPLGFYELSYLRSPESQALSKTYRQRVTDEIVYRIAASIGKQKKRLGGTDIPEAFRLYLEAKHILSERSEREAQVAQALLEEALSLDQDFSDAWTELSWSYYERVWAGGNGRIWAGLAVEAVENALSIEPDCVYANTTKIIFETELGDSDSALARAQKCTEENPGQAEYWYVLSYILRYMGHLEGSKKAMNQSLSVSPLFLTEIGDPPTCYLYSRRWSRFLQLTPSLTSPYFCYYRGYALWETGKKDEALFELKKGTKDDPKDNFSRLSQALSFIIKKEFDKANRVLTKLTKQRDLLEPGDCEFTYKEAKLLALAGNYGLAIDRLYKSFDGGFNCIAYSQTDPGFKNLRHFDRYKELKQRAELSQNKAITEALSQ